jgi:hypothetical protein
VAARASETAARDHAKCRVLAHWALGGLKRDLKSAYSETARLRRIISPIGVEMDGLFSRFSSCFQRPVIGYHSPVGGHGPPPPPSLLAAALVWGGVEEAPWRRDWCDGRRWNLADCEGGRWHVFLLRGQNRRQQNAVWSGCSSTLREAVVDDVAVHSHMIHPGPDVPPRPASRRRRRRWAHCAPSEEQPASQHSRATTRGGMQRR